MKTILGLCLLMWACNGGDGSDELPGESGGPPGNPGVDDDPGRCAPILYDTFVLSMQGTVNLTIDGTPIALSVDPQRVVRATDVDWVIDPIPSACAQVERVVQRDDGGWTRLTLWAAFTDANGNVVMTLSHAAGLFWLQVRHQGTDYEYAENQALPIQAPVVPGQPVTVDFGGVADQLQVLDDRDNQMPFSLDGTLRFDAPAYALDAAATTPVQTVYGCDPLDSRLLEVTADQPELLPFTGGCWDQGNTRIGGGQIRMDFRAEPEGMPTAPLSVIPWILTFDMAIAEEGASVLHIVPPDGIVDQLTPGLMPGQAQSFIEYARDGVYGHDWVAVDGSITVHDLSVVNGDPVVDGEFDVTYRFLGPADMDPTLDGEDVRVTGQLKIEPRQAN